MLRSTWEHQHHDLVSAKEECGKYPGVSVESLPFSFHENCHMFPVWFVPRFVITLPDTPFGMVCLFCGSLRHRARGPSERGFFSDLRSHLLVYSNRLRLLLLRRFGRAPFIQRPSTSCHANYHMPLSPILFLIFSHPHSIILLLVFFAPPLPPPSPLKTLHSNHRREREEKKR